MSGAAVPSPPLGPAGGGTSRGLGDMFATRARVVHALIMREMQTRFGRHNIGFAWLFFEPLFLGTVVGLMHSLHGKHMPAGIDPLYFSLVGYVPYFMFRAIVGRASTAMHANLTLLFHRQVTPLDIMLARNILEGVAVLGVVLLILGIGSWVTGDFPDNAGLVVLALFLMWLLSHGLSMCVAALTSRWEGTERFIHPMTYFMLPLSGAFIALDWLPAGLREVLLWVPLAHLHEAIREGVFGHRVVSYFDLGYVMQWVLGTNLVGVAALRTARRKLNVF